MKRKYTVQPNKDEILSDWEILRDERAEEIGAWMELSVVATYGEIARKFAYRDLDSILGRLKIAGTLDWDEWKPAPTLIKFQAMKRINNNPQPYNSEPIVHKDTKTYPTMAVSENYFRG